MLKNYTGVRQGKQVRSGLRNSDKAVSSERNPSGRHLLQTKSRSVSGFPVSALSMEALVYFTMAIFFTSEK